MKAVLYCVSAHAHQRRAMQAMATGLSVHGIGALVTDQLADLAGADFIASWGDRFPHLKVPRLILEGGYINGSSGNYVADRLKFISANWNGMHGLADPLPGECPSDRWTMLSITPAPWRTDGEYTLILDQAPNDAMSPSTEAMQRLVLQARNNAGLSIRRAHPTVNPNQEPLATQLQKARKVVTWASNGAVDAVLAGVPTVTIDQAAIAYPVTSHAVTDEPYCGRRDKWAYNLAYRQWTHDEMAHGTAWAFLKYGIE